MADEPGLPVLSFAPSAVVTATMLRGLVEAHASLGDYGFTVPEARFGTFFPGLELRLASAQPGVERTWDLSDEEWTTLLRDEFEIHFPLPRCLQIELSNRCNLSCAMCLAHGQGEGRRPLTRKQAFLDLDLYRRIIREATSDPDPRRRVASVSLQAWGESMMHPGILDAIACARDAGIPEIGLISNGTLIGKKHSVEDLCRAGLTRLQVSLDAMTPETYRAIRASDLFRDAEAAARNAARLAFRNRLERIARRLLGLKCVRPFTFTVSMAHQEANRGEVAAFVAKWTPRTVAVQVVPVYDRMDFQNVYFRSIVPRDPCSALWRNMLINVTGDVSICCADYDGRHIMARLSDGTSLSDAWRSAAYGTIRAEHLAGRGDATDICATCIGNGMFEKRPGVYEGFPAVYLPHLAYVHRRDSWLLRTARRWAAHLKATADPPR